MASRALVIRLRNSCSRSPWPAADRPAGRRARRSRRARPPDRGCCGESPPSSRPLGGGSPVRACRSSREPEHVAEDPPAHLDRGFDLAQVVGPHRRVDRAALRVHTKLLHQRQHRAQRVVHVVRDAAGDVGHRVLALGFEHPVLERFDSLEVLDGHRGVRRELVEEVQLVVAEHVRPGRRHLDDADDLVARHERRREDRGFGRDRVWGAGQRRAVDQDARPTVTAVPRLPPAAVAAESVRACRCAARPRNASATGSFVPMLPAAGLGPRNLLRDQLHRGHRRRWSSAAPTNGRSA